VPVMDGEFVVEELFRLADGLGGANFLILAETQEAGLAAAEAAVEAMAGVGGVILPFPGGVLRSGGKAGSRYKGVSVSSNTAYCPTLRGQAHSALPPGVGAVFEIAADGLDHEALSRSLALGIRAACLPGVVRISAGNRGGVSGRYHFGLHTVLA
jgi:formylmethanofuran--tetrahydromethanopterin N-formyltransferase